MIDLVDPRIQEDGFVENDVLQVNHVLQVIHVALFCLQPYANLRPPMSEVVAVLTCRADMVGTPMKPAFLDRKQDKNISSDTISEAFPSPLHSDSPSSSQQPKISEAFPSPLHGDSPSSSQQPK